MLLLLLLLFFFHSDVIHSMRHSSPTNHGCPSDHVTAPWRLTRLPMVTDCRLLEMCGFRTRAQRLVLPPVL